HLLPRHLLFEELGEDRRTRRAAGHGDERRTTRVDRAFDDESDVAGNRIGELVERIIFPPFGLNHANPSVLARRWLRVSEPSCNRLSAAVERWAEPEPVMRDVAQCAVDLRDPASAVDHAFGDIAASIDAQAHENGRTARPLLKQA